MQLLSLTLSVMLTRHLLWATSACMVEMWPFHAAQCSGLHPYCIWRASNTWLKVFTIIKWNLRVPTSTIVVDVMNIYRYSSSDIQGTLHVLKLTLSCMLTLKFLLPRSCFTTAVCPHFAALCRAVRPFCRRKNIFHVLRVPNNMYTMSRLGQQRFIHVPNLWLVWRLLLRVASLLWPCLVLQQCGAGDLAPWSAKYWRKNGTTWNKWLHPRACVCTSRS